LWVRLRWRYLSRDARRRAKRQGQLGRRDNQGRQAKPAIRGAIPISAGQKIKSGPTSRGGLTNKEELTDREGPTNKNSPTIRGGSMIKNRPKRHEKATTWHVQQENIAIQTQILVL
jgi:hypothetical protein